MRYFKHQGKLALETGYVSTEKVVFFRYVEEEHKDKCPHCNKPIEIEHNIVEGCRNWDSDIKPIETIK